MTGIIAISEDGGIGYKNKLPWPKIKEDLAFFKEKTLYKNIVVGYNTFVGLPPLKDRYIKVWKRDLNSKIEKFENGEFFNYSLFSRSEFYDYTQNDMLCGGAKAYANFIEYCDDFYVTKINGIYTCDSYFSFYEQGLCYKKNLIKEINGGHKIYHYTQLSQI